MSTSRPSPFLATNEGRRSWRWRRSSCAVVLGALALTPLVGLRFSCLAQTGRGAARARVAGIVGDSLHARALVNAVVSVTGTDRAARTNGNGEFIIDSLADGDYVLEVKHPLLDTLGIQIVTHKVHAVADSVTLTYLAIPSARTLVGRLCPADQRAGGAVFGRIIDADAPAPVNDASVTLSWRALQWEKKKKIQFTPESRTAKVGADGFYALCGLPEQLMGTLEVVRGATIAGPVHVAYDSGSVALQSLRVGARTETDTAVAVSDSAAATDSTKPKAALSRTGSATLIGWIVASDNYGVPDVRVSVVGTGVTTKSRADGKFVLQHMPSGTQVFVARRVGYASIDRVVELTTAKPVEIVVSLGEGVPMMASVEVNAEWNSKGLERSGFFRRQKQGLGNYVTGEQIRDRPIMSFGDIFLMLPVPQIAAFHDRRGNSMVQDRRGGPNQCVNIYIDHTLQAGMLPGDLDLVVRPDDVAALEVYSRSTTPAEFVPLRLTQEEVQSSGSPASMDGSQRGAERRADCATLVIWTKFMNHQR